MTNTITFVIPLLALCLMIFLLPPHIQQYRSKEPPSWGIYGLFYFYFVLDLIDIVIKGLFHS